MQSSHIFISFDCSPHESRRTCEYKVCKVKMWRTRINLKCVRVTIKAVLAGVNTVCRWCSPPLVVQLLYSLILCVLSKPIKAHWLNLLVWMGLETRIGQPTVTLTPKSCYSCYCASLIFNPQIICHLPIFWLIAYFTLCVSAMHFKRGCSLHPVLNSHGHYTRTLE